MQYLGDYSEDYATLNFKFSTHKADGTPITLSGTPAVKVYKANATDSETATGVTLTVDFDGVTGLNNVKIDLSADAFYAAGNDYSVVITTGTVDSVNVVGTVLAHFSIENRFNEMTVSDKTGFSLATAPPTAPQIRQEMDSNSTKLAAILEDTGTTIPALINADAGAGAISWEYTLTDSADGTPIDGAEVWATTDAAGVDVVASGTTDSFGKVTFMLDAGTYYYWRKCSGYNFSNPDTEVVS